MKKASIFLILVLTLLACSSYAFAWSPRGEGKPDMFRPGEIKGYFIWHNEHGIHIWTTTRSREHVFSGVIRTDGKFIDVRGQRLEHDDFYKVDNDRNKIVFRDITAGGGIDGLNFKIVDGERVNFDLFMDGEKIDPREIYIGENGWHPAHSDFTLHR